jgi:hypothetical protein
MKCTDISQVCTASIIRVMNNGGSRHLWNVTTRCYNPEDSKLNIQNVLGRRAQTERDDNQLILNKICYINTCPVQLQGYAYSNCVKSHVWSPRSPDLNPLKFYLLGHIRWWFAKKRQNNWDALLQSNGCCTANTNTPDVLDRTSHSLTMRCALCHCWWSKMLTFIADLSN